MNGAESLLVSDANEFHTCQHADHGEQDLLHALDWTPPFGAALVTHGIVTRGVEDRDAHPSVGIDWGGGGERFSSPVLASLNS